MLDDDDTWEPTKIEKQVKLMAENEKIKTLNIKEATIAIVICYSRIVVGSKEIIDKPKLKPTYDSLLKSFNFSSTSTFMIRKSVLEEIGGWNEELRGMHEYDIALKVTKLRYKIYTIPEILMTKYRFSETAGSDFFVKIAEVFDFWEYYGEDVMNNLGLKDCLCNIFKTLGLFVFFSLGYIFKQRIWNIIYEFKLLLQPRDII
jgi:GT2 family glycosyltransferase